VSKGSRGFEALLCHTPADFCLLFTQKSFIQQYQNQPNCSLLAINPLKGSSQIVCPLQLLRPLFDLASLVGHGQKASRQLHAQVIKGHSKHLHERPAAYGRPKEDEIRTLKLGIDTPYCRQFVGCPSMPGPSGILLTSAREYERLLRGRTPGDGRALCGACNPRLIALPKPSHRREIHSQSLPGVPCGS